MHYSDIQKEISSFDATPVVPAARPRKSVYGTVIKRVLDSTLVLCAAVIVVPVVLMLALVIWLRDWGNPFFCQSRLGQDGKEFTLFKLRSMVVDADQKLDAYLAENAQAREEWNTKQKLIDDPRITRFGQFLRKYSLDELPQLLNVLLGNMSLVGPRPMMPEQRDLYPGTAYFHMRPGVTGLWQISDRNGTSFAARAIFDNTYSRTMSLSTDLLVMWKTVTVMLRGTGH